VTTPDSFRRNPTEQKIKGHDIEFLTWALHESQRRTPQNELKRRWRKFWGKYGDPAKYVRRARKLLGLRDESQQASQPEWGGA
jgi:hypothetical protein